MRQKKLFRFYRAVSAVMGLSAFVGVLLLRPRLVMPWVQRSTHSAVLFHVNTDQKVLALTIDDGPHADITPYALDVLDKYNVKATFFLIGDHVSGNEPIVERIAHSGHEIGNHMMMDERSIQLSPMEFELQLRETDAILGKYSELKWFRPGSGFYNQQMLDQITANGYRTVLGSVYPYDAKIPVRLEVSQLLAGYVVANASPGAIIVLHDGREDRARLPDVLEHMIPALQADGYRFVTLSELDRLATD